MTGSILACQIGPRHDMGRLLASPCKVAGLPISAMPPPIAIREAEAKKLGPLTQAVDHGRIKDPHLAGDEGLHPVAPILPHQTRHRGVALREGARPEADRRSASRGSGRPGPQYRKPSGHGKDGGQVHLCYTGPCHPNLVNCKTGSLSPARTRRTRWICLYLMRKFCDRPQGSDRRASADGPAGRCGDRRARGPAPMNATR